MTMTATCGCRWAPRLQWERLAAGADDAWRDIVDELNKIVATNYDSTGGFVLF